MVKNIPDIGKEGLNLTNITKTHRLLYKLSGMKLISQGKGKLELTKVGVVVLMSDLYKTVERYKTIGVSPMAGTPSKKCILEMLIRKVKNIGERSVKEFGKNFSQDREPIIVYILTQNKENDNIFNQMEADNFYNYTGSFLFAQKDLPCFSKEGKIRMSSEKSIFLFPNGQGGVFPAMKSSDIFQHMYISPLTAERPTESSMFTS